MKTILLVEDNDALRAMFAIVLGDQYRVIEANNGIDGLRLFHELQPALIITDLSMPGMSGFVFIRTLRAQGSKVKIIACSALFNQGQDLEKAYEAGADRCLAKPLGIDQLLAMIEELLNS